MTEYKVVNESGVEVNGDTYAAGHVFNLSEDQINAEPFAHFIEGGFIEAVDLSAQKENTMNEDTQNTAGAEDTAADTAADTSSDTASDTSSDTTAAEGEKTEGEQA